MEPSQIDKFKAAAKKADCDMDEKSFNEVLGKIAQPEPVHDSDCAIYNAPAMEAGPCDCRLSQEAQAGQ